jgi:hypothetical protein
VVLDDCNFHECVRLDEFESSRTLTFLPPDGEFALLNYRVTGEFRCPFRIFPSVEEVAPYKVGDWGLGERLIGGLGEGGVEVWRCGCGDAAAPGVSFSVKTHTHRHVYSGLNSC